jgi:hypothetical protein
MLLGRGNRAVESTESGGRSIDRRGRSWPEFTEQAGMPGLSAAAETLSDYKLEIVSGPSR